MHRPCLLASLLALFVRTAFALPEFDFTVSAPPPSWTLHDLEKLTATDEGLALTISGGDPFVIMAPADFRAEKQTFLRLRLRSDAGGSAQLFWFKDVCTEKDSLRFDVPAGQWLDTEIPLPPLGDGWKLRLDPPGKTGRCVIALARVEAAGTAGLTHLAADATELTLTIASSAEKLRVVEIAPFQTLLEAAAAPALAEVPPGATSVVVPRWDGSRDRLYSGFAAVADHPRLGRVVVGAIRFVEERRDLPADTAPFPTVATKKGLQVQMVDDALALGVRHAGLNLDLGSLFDAERQPDSLEWKSDGVSYFFRRKFLEGLNVKPLSDAGVLVYLIIFTAHVPAPFEAALRHPRDDRTSPHGFTGFNTANAEGLRHFKAAFEFLGDYFARPEHGRVWGWILGNEVNAHQEWFNIGPATPLALAEDYERSARVAVTALRNSSAHTRAYLSFTHHWSLTPAGRELRQTGAKDVLENFARLARLGGDFEWHIAYHPYPENLYDPRSWLDKSARPDADSPRVTFKNLEVLEGFTHRPEMLHAGGPRRIILSEQGFNCGPEPDAEIRQAAGFCYAWEKVARLKGIDAFILHRHVDNRYEGGLNLGLWTRQPETTCTPDRHRRNVRRLLRGRHAAASRSLQVRPPFYRPQKLGRSDELSAVKPPAARSRRAAGREISRARRP